jgi:uncharacterized protein (DUF433 family)
MESQGENYIVATPDVRFGKPRIAGRRVAVVDIVLQYNRLGMSAEEIALEYELPLAAVHAALSYYYDHRREIEKSIEENENSLKQLAQDRPSLIEETLRRLTHA